MCATRALGIDFGTSNPKHRVNDGSLLLGGVELPVARVIAAVLGPLVVPWPKRVT